MNSDSYLVWKSARLASYERARDEAQAAWNAARERTDAAYREYERDLDSRKRDEWLACLEMESATSKKFMIAINRLQNAEKRATVGEFFKEKQTYENV